MRHRKAITEIAILVLNLIYCSRNLQGDILGILMLYTYLTFLNVIFIIFDIIWEFVICKGIIDYYDIKYDKKIQLSPLMVFSSIFIYTSIRNYIEGGILFFHTSFIPVLIPKIAEFIILTIKTKNKQQ